MLLHLVACANIQTQFQTVKNKPIIAPVADGISKKRICVQKHISQYIDGTSNHGIGLFIRDINDGRISEKDDTNITISANRIYLAGSLFKLHESKNQIFIMDNMPRAFTEELASSGYPPNEALQDLGYALKRDFSKTRKSDVGNIMFYIVDASFTRFDKEGSSSGFGNNIEYDKKSNGEFSFGKSNVEQYMTLTVNLIDARTNSIAESETFEILLSKNTKEKTFTVTRKGLGIGYTNQIEKIDSIHSAQNILLDYSAMWILDQFTHNNLLSKQCKI